MSDILAAALSLAGALLFLAAAIGLLRFPDFFTRLHAPTKAATLGMILIAIGSVVRFEASAGVWVQDALLVLFLMLTMPVSAQMLAKAALVRGERAVGHTRGAAPPPAARPFPAAGSPVSPRRPRGT